MNVWTLKFVLKIQITELTKKSEIKKMTKEQALKDIDKLKKDLFNFRFQTNF